MLALCLEDVAVRIEQLFSFLNIMNCSELKGKGSHVKVMMNIRQAVEDILAQDLLDSHIIQVSHLSLTLDINFRTAV